MEQTQTHVWYPVGEEAVAYSLARRNAAGEWRGRGVLSCTREKAMAVTCMHLGRAMRQTQDRDETEAKQKQPAPSACLDTIRGARAR